MSNKVKDTVTKVTGDRKRHFMLVGLIIRLVKEKPLATAGGIIVLLMLFVGVFADLLAPYGMNEGHLEDVRHPPSAQYLLGTDHLGRDLLSRIIFGARISMYVGLGASTLSVLIATIIGMTSGFFGGKFDLIVQRFVDAWMAFPGLVLILTVMALLGPGLVQVIVVIGVLSGITSSRVVRSATISIKDNAYVEAARAIGCPPTKILTQHILPNIMAPIIILFTIGMGGAILAEATLSFLGFGIPPPIPSWGGMLSGSGRLYMFLAPWLVIWPGVALSVVVYGINMLGDGIRDILDPRLRGGIGRYGRVKLKKAKGVGSVKLDKTKKACLF
jgi:peptide/nickel transport system permease protein